MSAIDTDELPKDGRSYRIWSVVEEIILDRYDELEDERMRDSYYLLREWLEPLRAQGEIKDVEFDYFVDNYEYYRDDFWPRIEERNGIRRPQTKPPTVVIEDGNEYTESHIPEAWHRARGFIFVEKSGMAEDLSLLSEHGWLIVAAQGESTRTFREAVASDGTDRPILVVTDADFYGGSIVESIAGHSDRTEHLELWKELEHRVDEIGLTQADADALDLPRERDPTQSDDKWRTELNALAVLRERESIENPLLTYVAAKMAALDIPLAPLPVDDTQERVKSSIRAAINEALSDEIDEVVESVVEGFDTASDPDKRGVGPLTQLRVQSGTEDGGVDLGDLRDELEDVAREKRDRIVWWGQSRYAEEVKTEIDAEAVDQMSSTLAGDG
jgi:hypothetical protein